MHTVTYIRIFNLSIYPYILYYPCLYVRTDRPLASGFSSGLGVRIWSVPSQILSQRDSRQVGVARCPQSVRRVAHLPCGAPSVHACIRLLWQCSEPRLARLPCARWTERHVCPHLALPLHRALAQAQVSIRARQQAAQAGTGDRRKGAQGGDEAVVRPQIGLRAYVATRRSHRPRLQVRGEHGPSVCVEGAEGRVGRVGVPNADADN